MSLTRRSFIKQTAAATAASAVGVALPALAAGVNKTIADVAEADVTWSKAPCRFCGTGCGVIVGVKAGRVVATQGDPLTEVNRGLNCVKGYFLSKIMYGEDRVITPLLRMKDGKYAKDGGFTPVDAFARFVSKYDADYVTKLSGVPKAKLDQLAELYANPNIKVMSFWTMGFNQHTRGTWANNMIYNLHLLTGRSPRRAIARSR